LVNKVMDRRVTPW